MRIQIPANRLVGAVPYVEVPTSIGRIQRPPRLGESDSESKSRGDGAPERVPRQRTLSEHEQARAASVQASIDAELRTRYSERAVRSWWRTRRGRLGMLTPAELLDLGCFETLFSECARTTRRAPDVALSDRDHGRMRDTLTELLRQVTEQDPQVSAR